MSNGDVRYSVQNGDEQYVEQVWSESDTGGLINPDTLLIGSLPPNEGILVGAPGVVVVSGAGDTAVNGTYIQNGTSSDKPLYDFGSQQIYWDGVQWVIFDSDNIGDIAYYATTDSAYPWDAQFFSIDPANDPVPSVLQGTQSLQDGLDAIEISLNGTLLKSNNLSDVDVSSLAFDNIKQSGNTNYPGVLELATSAETLTGTDTARAVTPKGLSDSYPQIITALLTSDFTVTNSSTRVNALAKTVPAGNYIMKSDFIVTVTDVVASGFSLRLQTTGGTVTQAIQAYAANGVTVLTPNGLSLQYNSSFSTIVSTSQANASFACCVSGALIVTSATTLELAVAQATAKSGQSATLKAGAYFELTKIL